MNLKTDCNNHAKHYYISDSDFMLNYTPYEQDQYNGRCYFLEDSRSVTSQAAREGGLVRRRISKANYEAALAECMAILSDERQVPAIDKDKILSDLVMVSDLTREGGTTPRISADDMIADFDTELRKQIDDPHYPTVDRETAKHELFGFMTALKELSIIEKDQCYVRPSHFGRLTYFPQIGEVLSNGHTVDAAYCVGINRYVMAHKDGAPEPYVVWCVDQDGDTRAGHYFTDQTRAQKYFASCCYDQSEEESESEEVIIRIDEIRHLKELLKRSLDDGYSGMTARREQSHAACHAAEAIYTAIITSDKTRLSLQSRMALLESLLYSKEVSINRLEYIHRSAIATARQKFSAEMTKQSLEDVHTGNTGGETNGEKTTATAEPQQ